MTYEEEDIVQYHTNGVIVTKTEKWLILNDETRHKINQILVKYANDESNRLKR